MKILFYFLLIVSFSVNCSLASPFNSLNFGGIPEQDMTCINGPCLDSNSPIYRPSKNPISTYLKNFDITLFNGVPISSPRYDYHEDKFFRVTFEITCDPSIVSTCIENAEDQLISNYGLNELRNSFSEFSKNKSIMIKEFEGQNSIRAKIIRKKTNGDWSKPFVQFYSTDLMSKLNLVFNTNYVIR